MKNVLISFILFVMMIICISLSINYLKNTCNDYKKTVSSLENTIKNESWDEAYKVAILLLDDWEKESKTISVFIDHVYLDGIYLELLRLSQYINCEDKSNSLASVHSVKFVIDDIIDFEKINIQNIF